MKFYKAPSKNFVQLNLDGSINASQTTITLNSVSDLQAPGAIVVDRVDANGLSTPALREVITFTGISGSQITGCTRGADGTTAQSHSDLARVDTALTVGAYNDLVGIVSTALDDTGTKLLVSTATITGTLNVSGASIVGINLNTFSNITVTGTANFQVGSFTSIASIARVETPRIEYSVSRMALNSNASGAIACDFDVANLFTRVLTASTTISLTNWSTGDKGIVRLVQGVSGATVAWNPGSGNTINWSGGSAPLLTYQLNKVDTIGFIGVSDTRIDGFIIGVNS